jgi:hypothetical protein
MFGQSPFLKALAGPVGKIVGVFEDVSFQ